MRGNRVFIFEFVSGGGFNQVDIPTSLFCEGYGMLRSIIADFKAMDFEVITLLDYRISFLARYLDVNFLKFVEPQDNYIKEFRETLNDCEFIFIIAPEFSNILYDLTKIAKDKNKKILSVDLEGIQLGSSKIKTYKYFKNFNVNTPKTYQIPEGNYLDLDFIIQKFNEFNSPVIIKPEDGVGAESIYFFQEKSQINKFFKEAEYNIDPNRNYIIQEYIEGEDLSASLIGTPKNAKQTSLSPLILSINFQDIKIKNLKSESEYFGGYTPVENYEQIKKKLSKILEKLDLSMFNSYFGIDFIRGTDSITFIEINPRLTTSYIGIRNTLNFNPVEAILNTFYDSLDFKNIEIRNHSIFKRLELNYVGDRSINEIRDLTIPKLLTDIPEFVTPPISFYESNQNSKIHFSCFIATKEKDINYSQKRLTEIKEALQKKYNFKIIK